MPLEKSAGVVIFRREGGRNFFLLLRYPAANHRCEKDYWDYVKGHIEGSENSLETIKREAREETGINDLKFVDGFEARMDYFFTYQGQRIDKIVFFLLAEVKTKEVVLSDEHNDFVWLPYQEAYQSLSFLNAKEVLKKANAFLESKGI